MLRSEAATCVASAVVVKCSSRVMNGGSGRSKGSAVNAFKKQDTRTETVNEIMVVFLRHQMDKSKQQKQLTTRKLNRGNMLAFYILPP